jgi:hypothetical protein
MFYKRVKIQYSNVLLLGQEEFPSFLVKGLAGAGASE